MRLVTGVVLSGGVLAGGAGLAAGTAQAAPNPACNDIRPCYTWCPGEPMPNSDAPLAWDMGVCHDYYYIDAPGRQITEGMPPVREQLPPWQP